MCGCWRLAVVLISARKRSAPTTAASSGLEDFEGDLAVVLEIVGQVDGGHSAFTQLSLDGVAAF